MATRPPRQPAANSSATANNTTPAAPAPSTADSIQSVKHNARRKNIPPAGIEAQGQVQEAPRLRYAYNPHLPPRLRFSNDPAQADRLPLLLQTARTRALTEPEAQELANALRRHEPWLEWAGKRERPWFEVEPPALHIHDRVSTQAMCACWRVRTRTATCLPTRNKVTRRRCSFTATRSIGATA